MPLVLASLFTLSALATLVHVLVTSVRRRRKDLAILRTLGFKKRQVVERGRVAVRRAGGRRAADRRAGRRS